MAFQSPTNPLSISRFAFVMAAMLGCLFATSCKRTPQQPPTPAAAQQQSADISDPAVIALNNRGVGLMGQYDYEAARAIFQQLLDAHPDWLEVKVNLAIATLNRQREGDEDAALLILEQVLQADPDHMRAHYCTGLLRLYLQSPDNALPHFQRVANEDADDAYAAYYVAQCLAQTRQYEQAIEWYEKAISNDSYLRSAYYAASQSYRALQRNDDAAAMIEQFQALERNPRARLAEFKYKRMGPKGEALAVNVAKPQPMPKPEGPVFADAHPLLTNGDQFAWTVRRDDRPVSITACDINGDSLIDVFIANVLDSDGLFNAVCISNGDGTFTLDADHVLASIPDVNAALWGDYDNDGLTDVYLCRRGPNMLWRQLPSPSGRGGEGTPTAVWQDVTALTGTSNDEFDSVDGAMFDADHDGDLDIFVVNYDGPNELLNNNLDGTFRPIAAQQNIAGDGSGSIAVQSVDIDNDRDVDIVVYEKDGSKKVWINDRLWQYRSGEVMSVESKLQEQLRHGWIEEHAKETDAIGWLPIVLNAADGPSLVTFSRDGRAMIHRPGPGRHQFATLSFTGRKEGDTMRSNASGIGTHFAARIDSMWIIGSTLKSSMNPGQSLQPIAIDLHGYPQIDFVSIDWSDGVFQSEIDLKAGEHHIITETQRQLSSCPVLFAWNGSKYEFISDVLGVAGIGYMVAPHEYSTPRPWENFMFPQDMLKPRDDRYEIKLGEPMEEALYLDAARLVAYDLPPGWKMTLDERMSILGPAPTGEPRFYRRELLPIAAVNDRDEDVLDSILKVDHAAAPVGEHDERFIGRLKRDHVLTLSFAELINSSVGAAQPMLVIDGWVEYPYSQTMFGASQAKADYRAPTIEARDEIGKWHVVMEQFGYMAGMPRQMSVPLVDLPPNTNALRISTNQEIYFDRIAIAFAETAPTGMVRHELQLTEARVNQSGFALRTTGAQRLPHYDYDRRSPYWDTRYQRGLYTQLGEMTELVSAVDDAVAIIGPGEEIHLEFAAELPKLSWTLGADASDESESAAVGGPWSRVFVLELNGWCKDMDLFTKDGETIEPLPTSRSGDEQWQQNRSHLHHRYNTRFESWK